MITVKLQNDYKYDYFAFNHAYNHDYIHEYSWHDEISKNPHVIIVTNIIQDKNLLLLGLLGFLTNVIDFTQTFFMITWDYSYCVWLLHLCK